ncbi:phosphotransferase [Methanocella sp. CWC-04]|uniref:Phosphotransferase n=1 Tax=Methanooceanicella nereidis TaxID=2052831 RepID=A0AAP2W7T1_9EURY|nr:phosphotransferase [Methanocella sp. CWC-04]MCD1295376.1 phosphotransferase [Methanocella sp. CWC-04]
MLETQEVCKDDREVLWIREMIRGNPELFPGDKPEKILVLHEKQVSSHHTHIYDIDDVYVHVKFFNRTKGRTNVTYDPIREMRSEYEKLLEYEKKGFGSGKYRVVKALGINADIDSALATMYVGGKTVQSVILDVIKEDGDPAMLYMALELTAGLLKKIHTVMPQSYQIDQADMFYSYLKSLLYLEEQNMLGGYHRRTFKGLTRWYNYKPLFDQRGVTVHGDANPSNFKIDNGIIYAFDMERSKGKHSPVIDLGAMVSELKHQFAYLTNDGGKAEPYIEHFLSSYAADEAELEFVKSILPFYVSQSLFKIAMLGYWDREYKKYLVEEGTKCIEVEPL